MYKKIRDSFPFFKNRPDIIYLDNAATTQKPQPVIDTLTDFYAFRNAPVHRGVYQLAEEATIAFEGARSRIAGYLCIKPEELIFTKGTTEAFNCIAAFIAQISSPDDEVIITELEHHSNFLPWVRLAYQKKITLRVVPVVKDGSLDYTAFYRFLSKKTRLVSITHTSNVLGSQPDLSKIIDAARSYGAYVAIDAAQPVFHQPLSISELQPDFLAFSGHKMGGPTGIGVLYVASALEKIMEPFMVGGGMVYSVDHSGATWLQPPQKYEAGTQPIAQALGLEAAFTYLHDQVFSENIRAHEADLCSQLIEGLKKIDNITILGDTTELSKSGHLVSFVSSKYHAHDIAAYLSTKGICVRAGNHCAQPLHKSLGMDSSVRVSMAPYTSENEIEELFFHLQRM